MEQAPEEDSFGRTIEDAENAIVANDVAFTQGRTAESDFIFACTNNPQQSIHDAAVLLHARRRIGRCKQPFESIICADFHPDCSVIDRILYFSSEIADGYRAAPTISLSRLMLHLVGNHTIIEPRSIEDEFVIKRCLFSAIGIMSLLYIPSDEQNHDRFQVDSQGAPCFVNTSVGMAMSTRPPDELLRAFGEMFPRPCKVEILEKAPTRFQVSHLNASTLRRLAGIQIIWVDAMSAHLDFDPMIPALYLFKLPSFCKLRTMEKSFLSILAQDFFLENDAIDFSIRGLMNEIVLSYGLLFRNDRSARKLYRKVERQRAMLDDESGIIDPVLDDLCGMSLSTSIFSWGLPVRDAYDSRKAFPIYERRLIVLQDFIAGIEPSKLSVMWNDRRDLRMWYTIWAVLIVGGISIVQAFISMDLSAAQVALASKAYELQKSQGQSSSPSLVSR